MEKTCIKCNTPKPLNQFTKCKPCDNGVKNICKICTRRYMSDYKERNLEKLTKYHKFYRTQNSEKNKNYLIDYNKKPEVKQKKREYYLNNIQYYRDIEKTDKRKKYRYEHNKNSIYCKWRNLLNNSLKRLGKEKEGHTIDLLGYSALDLKNHIQSLFTDGMSWENHGEWHIDHINEVCKFDKNTPSHIVNALSNLRPLWATTREVNGVVYEGNLNRHKK